MEKKREENTITQSVQSGISQESLTEPTLTVDEVAAYTGLTRATINYHIHVSGALKGFLVNPRLRKFTLTEIKAFMENTNLHRPGPVAAPKAPKVPKKRGRTKTRERWKAMGGVGSWRQVGRGLRVRINRKVRVDDGLVAWFFDWADVRKDAQEDQRRIPVYNISPDAPLQTDEEIVLRDAAHKAFALDEEKERSRRAKENEGGA